MSDTEDSDRSLSSNSKVVLEIDAFPFKGLNISEDWKKLDSIENRSTCSMCKKSRKYFCYTCYIPVPEVQHIVPKLKLPVKVDIIKHAREMDGKSTAVHAAVLAPEDVRIFTYPCIPDYDPHENVVLVFPNKDAVSVQEICERFFRKVRPLDKKRLCHYSRQYVIQRVVFIDSTWNQSRGIFKDPRIKALPSVVLKARLSQFWRHQADSPRWYLATIEAIHQFIVELDAAQWQLDHRTASESCMDEVATSVSSDQIKLSECEEIKVNKSKDDLNHPTSEVTRNQLSSGNTLKEEVEHLNSTETVGQINNLSDSISETGYLKSDCDGKSEREQHCHSGGKYDNLLFFFRFMYSKIHSLYDHDQLRSYKRRLE